MFLCPRVWKNTPLSCEPFTWMKAVVKLHSVILIGKQVIYWYHLMIRKDCCIVISESKCLLNYDCTPDREYSLK